MQMNTRASSPSKFLKYKKFEKKRTRNQSDFQSEVKPKNYYL